jgi:LuxR family maltose regulon positive regulatory protein
LRGAPARRRDGAQLALDAAVASAMHEGHLQAFLDMGPLLLPALQLARASLNGPSPRVRDRFLHTVFDRLEAHDAHPRAAALSERERAVAGMLGQGLSNKAIARSMRVSDNTVKFHLKTSTRSWAVATRRDARGRTRSPRVELYRELTYPSRAYPPTAHPLAARSARAMLAAGIVWGDAP